MGLFDREPTMQRDPIVHYVMEDGDYLPTGAYAGTGQVQGGVASAAARPHHRPAVMVETWGNEVHAREELQTVNLLVFMDGMNDGYATPTLWKTGVKHNEKQHLPGTWHWAEHP